MAHHFNESQKAETAHFGAADKFYKLQLEAEKIDRCDYNTTTGREFQQNDIDLWLTLENQRISVSEKKRAHDFNDLYLETHSKFPDIEGWTMHSKADFLAYFFPERVFWAGFRQIIRFYRESLLPQIQPQWFDLLNNNYPLKSGQEKHEITIAGCLYTISLIQAYNESDGNSWYTMGIGIPFEMLKDNHIKFKIYPTGKF